jgi:hypothetical protein
LSSRGQRLCCHADLNFKTITLRVFVYCKSSTIELDPDISSQNVCFLRLVIAHFLSNHPPSSADCYILVIPLTCWHECKQNVTTSRLSDLRVVSPPPIVCCLSDSVANEATVMDAKRSSMSAHESLPLVMTHYEMGMAHLRMHVLEQHCHSNGRRPPQMRPESSCPGD